MTADEMLKLKDEYPDAFRVLEDTLFETDREFLIKEIMNDVITLALDKDIVIDYRLVETAILIKTKEDMESRLSTIQDEIYESRIEEHMFKGRSENYHDCDTHEEKANGTNKQ